MATNGPVVIIGGGLAGLCCARVLHQNGIEFQLLEASDQFGGRVRTDEVEGFRLDRGFQVLLTAYPEAKKVLDYDRLNLKRFTPGAIVRAAGAFHRIADPWRQPTRIIETALAKVGSLADKLRIARLRAAAGRGSFEELFKRPESTTHDELKRIGFSDTMIDRFFRPFLGGVFLDSELATSSRMLHFVFRMFSEGDTALPAEGMGAIPLQIAAGLPDELLRLNAPVEAIDEMTVRLVGGECVAASSIVVATDEGVASRLLPELATPRTARSVTCLYFAADRPPISEPILVLNGEGRGLVNNLCVPTAVSPTYSPDDQSLISATVLDRGTLDDAELEAGVREQMAEWFGPSVSTWRHLKTYDIKYALPDQRPPLQPAADCRTHREGVFLCGDYRQNASIHGAMVSGRLAAEAILASQ